MLVGTERPQVVSEGNGQTHRPLTKMPRPTDWGAREPTWEAQETPQLGGRARVCQEEQGVGQ